MSETYTLDEARRELVRRECASEGHRPDTHLRKVGDLVGTYLCACGEVTWKPTRRD